MMTRHMILSILAVLLIAATASAHDYVPAPPQVQPILLSGGDLYTVSHGIMPRTDLLFSEGRITAIGTDLDLPPETIVIDVTGGHVYPGLIAANTALGLVEIGAVRATVDLREVGRVHPEVKAWIAYNPDSEIIPTIRCNGVTYAHVVPSGQLIDGRSSLMKLDGWTREDCAEKPIVGMHMHWPRAAVINAWWMEQTAEEQKEQMEKNRAAMRDVFTDARAYFLARQAGTLTETDVRWEAMLPLFTGEMPLFVHADDYRQIEQAVYFGKEQQIDIVIVGGREADKAVDLLAEYDVPVIVGRVHRLPMREDDDYDLPFRTPKILHDAGVPFCIAMSSATGARNLPFQAGQAVAFGLDPETALRSITLSTAEILGVDDRLGSLDVGKQATVVVCEGDILDYRTSKVTRVYIDGRDVDLDSKQKELERKYRARYEQP